MQVVLYEGTDQIRVQVMEPVGDEDMAGWMVGMESTGGASGLDFPGCNTAAATHAGQAIVFSPPSSGSRVMPGSSKGWDVAGDTFSHEFSVANFDATDAAWSIAVSGPGAWTTTPSATTLDVPAGGHATLTVDVDIPSSAAPGSNDRSTITLTPAAGTPVDLTVTTSAQDPPEEWQVVTDMPNWVIRPTVATEGDTLYLMGGLVGDEPSPYLPRSNYLQAFDTSTLTWNDSVTGTLAFVPPNDGALLGHAACGMNGRLYLVGDDRGEYATTYPDLYIYDIATDTWSQGAGMPDGRSTPAMVCDEPHGKLYVIGGFPFDDSAHYYVGSGDLWAYDADADAWDDTLSPHPLLVNDASAEMVEDGVFLVAGGFEGEMVPSVRTFTYTIATDTWEESGELNTGRSYQESAPLPPGRMCILGGQPRLWYPSGVVAAWECWMDGVWTPMPVDMTEPRYYFAAGAVGGTVYAIGGLDWNWVSYTHTTVGERYPSGPLPDTSTDATGDTVEDTPDDAPADLPDDVPADTSTDAPDDTAADTGEGGGDDGGCSCSMAR